MTPEYWAALEALTPEEVLERARRDPDAQPLEDRPGAVMRRVAMAKRIRWNLRLSQSDFAAAYRIPIGTLRDWEQHRAEPDACARAYLAVIAAEPEIVRKALAKAA